MPKLIDATIAPGSSVDLAALNTRLRAAAPDSVLDDHSRWIARLKSLANAVVWSAYGILLLIAVATAAAVSFATRAGLEAHHEIVELLHQMGAQSGFIARSFERHYFLSALGAAAVGAAFAGILFVMAGGLEFAGIEAVRISRSIQIFVMVNDHVEHLGRQPRHFLQRFVSHQRMLAHHRQFIGIERTGLFQDGQWNASLADVMQQSGGRDLLLVDTGEVQMLGECDRHPGDGLHHVVDALVIDDDFQLELRDEIHPVLDAAVELGM
jgi:hypothetical protein